MTRGSGAGHPTTPPPPSVHPQQAAGHGQGRHGATGARSPPIRSLGDLRLRIVEGKEVASFWDIEKPRFALAKGPSGSAWTRTPACSAACRTPPGNADVVVR